MKCIKCNGENFILESSIVLKEKYRIYKNGKIAENYFLKEIEGEDMTDNENIIRCITCN